MSVRAWEVWKRDWWVNAPPSTRYNELAASSASVLTTTYGLPDYEKVLPTFQSYADNGYSGNAVVFAVVLARLNLFSEAEFKFQDLKDKHLYGNTDLLLLEEPWPNGTTGELLARMEQDASLAGNAYIRDAGLQLERLRPDRVTIVSALHTDAFGRPYRVVVGYAYDRAGDGTAVELYDVDEVAHWSPVPDPLAQFRGMSWLTPVVREINADTGMTDYKLKYLENAATPNLLIKYEKELKPGTVEAVGERIKARFGGMENAYKTLVLDNGADATIVGGTFEQMNFATVQAAGENRIASAAGVPGIVAGLKEGLQAATYSNYAQAMRRFADITMRPNWRSACGALAKLVAVPAGSRLWFDTSSIAALQAGEQERAQVFSINATAAATLINAGYAPDTVGPAIQANDLALLKHTGLIPVQVQPPGETADAPSTSDGADVPEEEQQ